MSPSPARATDDFVLAVLAVAVGTVVAVVFGKPEAAVLVTPWAVALIVGVGSGRRGVIDHAVRIDRRRCVAGDEIEIDVVIAAEAGPQRVQAANRGASTPLTGGGAPGIVTVRPTTGFAWRPAATEPAGRAVTLGPGQTTTVTHRLEAARWGTHATGGADVEWLSPHGLFRRRWHTGRGPLVRVHPPPRRLRELVTPYLVRRRTGSHPATTSDRGIEYADLRPFTGGDSPRDIDWRASARAGELWVAQRHPDRTADVVLLVDSFVESGHDVETIFGLTIEAALAVADGHLARVDRVGLIELGGVVRWVAPGTGRLALHRLTDALLATRLYATAADRDLAAVPVRALPPRTFVVGISPLLDDRYVDNLIALRAAGHDVAVIECVVPVEPPIPVAARPVLGRRKAAPIDGSAHPGLLAWRLWEAERAMVRDRLGERGVAIGRWHQGSSLEEVIGGLLRHRRHLRTVRP